MKTKRENKTKTVKFTVMMIAATLVLCMSVMTMPLAKAAGTYDLVILNGRVMDPETMLDAVRNVGVKNGKIVTITKERLIE